MITNIAELYGQATKVPVVKAEEPPVDTSSQFILDSQKALWLKHPLTEALLGEMKRQLDDYMVEAIRLSDDVTKLHQVNIKLNKAKVIKELLEYVASK